MTIEELLEHRANLIRQKEEDMNRISSLKDDLEELYKRVDAIEDLLVENSEDYHSLAAAIEKEDV